MKLSNSVIQKKKRGPKPTGITPLVALRLPDDLTKAIDAWAADQPEKLSRSQAIRFAIKDWLVANGRLKP